jgi:hypothetical protein
MMSMTAPPLPQPRPQPWFQPNPQQAPVAAPSTSTIGQPPPPPIHTSVAISVPATAQVTETPAVGIGPAVGGRWDNHWLVGKVLLAWDLEGFQDRWGTTHISEFGAAKVIMTKEKVHDLFEFGQMPEFVRTSFVVRQYIFKEGGDYDRNVRGWAREKSFNQTWRSSFNHTIVEHRDFNTLVRKFLVDHVRQFPNTDMVFQDGKMESNFVYDVLRAPELYPYIGKWPNHHWTELQECFRFLQEHVSSIETIVGYVYGFNIQYLLEHGIHVAVEDAFWELCCYLKHLASTQGDISNALPKPVAIIPDYYPSSNNQSKGSRSNTNKKKKKPKQEWFDDTDSEREGLACG